MLSISICHLDPESQKFRTFPIQSNEWETKCSKTQACWGTALVEAIYFKLSSWDKGSTWSLGCQHRRYSLRLTFLSLTWWVLPEEQLRRVMKPFRNGFPAAILTDLWVSPVLVNTHTQMQCRPLCPNPTSGCYLWNHLKEGARQHQPLLKWSVLLSH